MCFVHMRSIGKRLQKDTLRRQVLSCCFVVFFNRAIKKCFFVLEKHRQFTRNCVHYHLKVFCSRVGRLSEPSGRKP